MFRQRLPEANSEEGNDASPNQRPSAVYNERAGLEKFTERRHSPRYRTVMRAARLSSAIHSVQGLGLVRNISEGGMLVHSHLGFRPGEPVTISLVDCDTIEGVVVWQEGEAVGIKFRSWVSVEKVLTKSPTHPNAPRPRPPRLCIDSQITVRANSFLADARICDISQRGAKIRFAKHLPIDCRIQISQPDLRPVTGSVKWQVGDLVGIEFHRTLNIEELSSWTEVGKARV